MELKIGDKVLVVGEKTANIEEVIRITDKYVITVPYYTLNDNQEWRLLKKHLMAVPSMVQGVAAIYRKG